MKVRRHQWDGEVVRDDVTKNLQNLTTLVLYVSNVCNINITIKLNKRPGFAHNTTRYDNNFVLSGITGDFKPPNRISNSGVNFFKMDVIPKTEDN